MTDQAEIVRTRFLWVASLALTAAIFFGYPQRGMLHEGAQAADSLAAFHLAVAGVDRAVWEIEQKQVPLADLYAGRDIDGLSGDRLYHDVPGGSYKVAARFDPSRREFQVRGTGIDERTGQTRSLEVVLTRQPNAERLRQVSWREVQPEGAWTR